MRTTVTIDPDTEALIREEVKQTGKSFKRVLNESVRASLGGKGVPVKVKPLFSAPFPASLEGRSFNHLADEWDDDDTVKELSAS